MSHCCHSLWQKDCSEKSIFLNELVPSKVESALSADSEVWRQPKLVFTALIALEGMNRKF